MWSWCYVIENQWVDAMFWYDLNPRNWELRFVVNRYEVSVSLLFVGVSVWF